MAPLPPLPWSGRGRPPKLMRRDAEHHPVSVKALALGLPAASWQTVSWREGSRGSAASRFARVRVRAAHRDAWRAEPRDEEWLLIEWPEGDAEPAKYWLSTLPPDIPFDHLVDLAKLRWRIERDYQELKQELGLGHYEGRGWRGFHHHATLVHRRLWLPDRRAGEAFPLSRRRRRRSIATPEHFPKFYTPRRSRPPRTTCCKLDRDDAPTPDRCPRNTLARCPRRTYCGNRSTHHDVEQVSWLQKLSSVAAVRGRISRLPIACDCRRNELHGALTGRPWPFWTRESGRMSAKNFAMCDPVHAHRARVALFFSWKSGNLENIG